MRIIVKITIVTVIIMFYIFQSCLIYAAVVPNPDKYNPDSHRNPADEEVLVRKVSSILGLVRNIGILVSVGALMTIGIKTMTGSIEEKSKYKQSLPVYILGAMLLMAMTTLPSIIYNAVNSL